MIAMQTLLNLQANRMKHFELKNTLAGSKGGAPDPKPATLKPPKIGDYSVAASFSFSETIDLISDGPILGLTNEDGYVLDESSYLQGLYFNDIPVEVSNNSFAGSEAELLNDFEDQCLSESVSGAFNKISESSSYNWKDVSYVVWYVNISRGFEIKKTSRKICYSA